MLVKVPEVAFKLTPNVRGSSQVRALFSYEGNDYNLVVTDITWENRTKKLEALNCHFKLVVGVIPVKEQIKENVV